MEKELANATEFIKDRLYFCCMRKAPRVQQTTITFNHSHKLSSQPSKVYFITVDDKFTYEPFFEDFGPINLGQVHRFCKIVDDKLNVCVMVFAFNY